MDDRTGGGFCVALCLLSGKSVKLADLIMPERVCDRVYVDPYDRSHITLWTDLCLLPEKTFPYESSGDCCVWNSLCPVGIYGGLRMECDVDGLSGARTAHYSWSGAVSKGKKGDVILCHTRCLDFIKLLYFHYDLHFSGALFSDPSIGAERGKNRSLPAVWLVFAFSRWNRSGVTDPGSHYFRGERITGNFVSECNGVVF